MMYSKNIRVEVRINWKISNIVRNIVNNVLNYFLKDVRSIDNHIKNLII